MRSALCSEANVLLLQAAQLEQLLDDPDQLLVVPGLGHVVVGPLLDELHGNFERAPGGEKDDRQVGIEVPQGAKERHAALTRRVVLGEVHVLDDDPDVLAGHEVQRLLGTGRGQRLEAVQLEQDLERGADRGLIVDDENFQHANIP